MGNVNGSSAPTISSLINMYAVADQMADAVQSGSARSIDEGVGTLQRAVDEISDRSGGVSTSACRELHPSGHGLV